MMNTLHLLLAALCLLCVKCQQLTQPASVTVQPGQSLSISCRVSYSLSSYYTAWIRQPAGKGLEWIGAKRIGYSTFFKDSLKNQFSIDLQSSSNTVTLNGQNMQPQDTAVYFCARALRGWRYFDYWGKGTQVTVTSATSTAPTVFPVLPCGSGTGDTVTLACLATGFSPSAVNFAWSLDDNTLTDSIQYPPVLKDNVYSGVSQLQVKRQEWNARKTFKCKVDHAAGSKEVQLIKPKLRIVSPNITLYPTWEGEFPASPVKLTCTLGGFYPDELINLSWTKNQGSPLDTAPTERKLKSTGTTGTTFSLSSEIEPDMNDWQNGSSFTCTSFHQNTEYNKSISICKFIASTPLSVHLDIPSFQTVVTATSQVKASCIVHSITGATVTWLMDGKLPSADQITIGPLNATHILSNLTVQSGKWKQMSFLTCRAEHPCFSPKEKTVEISGPKVTPPVVTIRRSLSDLLKGDSTVLECDITKLSSSDLYVTLQSNGLDISPKQFVHIGKDSGLHSISTRFPVSKNDWNKHKSFTCKVSQGFFNSFTSNSTGNIFVEPSMQLILAPSKESGPQTLSCTAWGFNPQIEWLSGSQKRSESTGSISMNAAGRVVVTSQLQVAQTEWKTGKVFTCEVSDKSLNKMIKEDISVCSVPGHLKAPPLISVESPSFRPVMMANSEVKASCTVRTVFEAEVTWLMDGSRAQSNTVRQSVNTTHIISELTLPSNHWKTLKHVTCRAKHACFPDTEKTVSVAEVVYIRPSLKILTFEDNEKITFSCLANDFTPNVYEFKWLKNNEEITDKTSEITTPSKDRKDKNGTLYTAASFLTLSSENMQDTHVMCIFNLGSGENVQSVNSTHTYKPCSGSDVDVQMEIIPPSVEHMLLLRKGKLVCKVTVNTNPQNVRDFFWSDENNDELVNGTDRNKNKNSLFTLPLDITYDEWNSGITRTCEMYHDDLLEPLKKTYQRKKEPNPKRPSVFMLPPLKQTSEKMVTLTCYVKDFFPQEIYVRWQVDNGPTNKFSATNSIQSNGSYYAYSQLTIPLTEWENSNREYSCQIYHESIDQNSTIIRSIAYHSSEQTNMVNLNMNLPSMCTSQ